MQGFVNTARTGGLFIVMLVLFAAVGFVIGGVTGGDPASSMLLFLVIAALFNVVALMWGDRMVLAAYRAREVDGSTAPKLCAMVAKVSHDAGLPTPRTYVIGSATPNAFATGRSPKHGKVAFTTGIMEILDEDELEGVIAHEMAHIKNRDMVVMTVAATVAAAIGFAVRMAMFRSLFGGRDAREALPLLIIVAVTAPLAAMLIQMAISRTREFRADAIGARFTGRPLALANALEKLERGVKARPMDNPNPAHAALFIANPLKGRGLARLFTTHPPMAERVARLRAMAY